MNLVINCVFISLVQAKVLLQNIQVGNSVPIKAYNALAWSLASPNFDSQSNENTTLSSLNETNYTNFLIPVIPLHVSNDYGYNPCVEGKHQAHIFADIASQFHSNQHKDLEMMSTWIAHVDYKEVLGICDGTSPLHMWYSHYVALHAQQLGASAAIITGATYPKLGRRGVPPEVVRPKYRDQI